MSKVIRHSTVSRRSTRALRIAALSLVLVATACGSTKNNSSTPPTLSSSSSSSVPSSSTTTVPAGSSAFAIYLVKSEHLVAAGRAATRATPESAVGALLAGPQGTIERNLGFTSAIPAGTTLHNVAVSGSVATVNLSRRFESGGGTLSMQERVGQVVFTVTQFSGVNRVKFQLDGTPVTSIGGEGLMVDGLGRADVTSVTPLILVESPTPDASITPPLHVRGISNTFEATVNYTLTDPDGVVLKEGFTTATAGTGTWGTFAFDVAYSVTRTGMGNLMVYAISSQNGSRINLQKIPVRMSP